MLAEGAVGNGLGSRALLAALKRGAVLHDASYWLALELSGHSSDLLDVLTAVRHAPWLPTTSQLTNKHALCTVRHIAISALAQMLLDHHANGHMALASVYEVCGVIVPQQ